LSDSDFFYALIIVSAGIYPYIAAIRQQWGRILYSLYRKGEYKIRPYEINPIGRNDDQGRIFFIGNHLIGGLLS